MKRALVGLLLLAPSVVSAQAVVRRVPAPGEPNIVDYRIFFRGRGELLYNLDLDRGLTPKMPTSVQFSISRRSLDSTRPSRASTPAPWDQRTQESPETRGGMAARTRRWRPSTQVCRRSRAPADPPARASRAAARWILDAATSPSWRFWPWSRS